MSDVLTECSVQAFLQVFYSRTCGVCNDVCTYFKHQHGVSRQQFQWRHCACGVHSSHLINDAHVWHCEQHRAGSDVQQCTAEQHCI
jgi:hypothetical protein